MTEHWFSGTPFFTNQTEVIRPTIQIWNLSLVVGMQRSLLLSSYGSYTPQVALGGICASA